MELASSQFERAKRTAVSSFIIMFDVDHFKNVNDTYGHIMGDKVLICIAERVQKAIRPYDLFGRYGGEEFIMLVSDINEKDIENYTERMRAAINNISMVFDQTELTVSASFGVASVTAADSLHGVINIADEALYKAKNSGRNNVTMAT